jgi:hypothetical protein
MTPEQRTVLEQIKARDADHYAAIDNSRDPTARDRRTLLALITALTAPLQARAAHTVLKLSAEKPPLYLSGLPEHFAAVRLLAVDAGAGPQVLLERHLLSQVVLYVEALQDALGQVQWTRDCGIDGVDPDRPGQLRNFPAAERDAMYDIAAAAVGPSEDALRYESYRAKHVVPGDATSAAPAEAARIGCDRARLVIEQALVRNELAASTAGKEALIAAVRGALDAEVEAGGAFLPHDPEDEPREAARVAGAEGLGRGLASALVADETVSVESFEAGGRYLGPHVRAWLRRLLDLSPAVVSGS